MAKVLIPTALLQYAGGKDELDVPGRTVEETLKRLTEQYPALGKQLFNEKGELRHFVNIYKGAEDTRALQGMATLVTDTDELSIVPSIAGGAGTIVEGIGNREQPLRPTPNTQPPTPNARAIISEERTEAAELNND